MRDGVCRPTRVALVSTAAADAPGSMQGYADTLTDALTRFAPEIQWELVQLEPRVGKGRFAQRLQTMSQLWRARNLRQRPDVWHVLDGSKSILASQLPAGPCVVTVHDIIPWLQDRGRFPPALRLGAAARQWWRGNGRALQRAALVACDSRRSAEDIQSAFGVQAAKCRILPLPLRPSLAARVPDPSRPREDGVVLHVGNNAFYKNRAGALRVFARMDPAFAVELSMVGPPPDPDLRALSDSLGIAARIRWLVDPSDQDLIGVYRRSSVLLFPSLYEGFGWPVLEAMALGLPVVSSDAGSLPEVVGNAGVMRPVSDEGGLASETERLLRSPEARAAAAERGAAQAAKFDAATFARRMAETYHDAVGPAGRAVA